MKNIVNILYKRKYRKVISLLVLVFAILFGKEYIREPANFVKPSSQTVATESGEFLVTKVIDGDTLRVSINGKNQTVRLLGIDTPEVVDPRKTVQCFGKEASQETKWLAENTLVRLEGDSTQGDTDKYNRKLRYVFLSDGTMLNETLVRNGYAFEYTYDLPYTYQKNLKDAQREAMQNNRGLWASDTCAGKR